jgi:myo-inositol-1(or 4)-monophosphatase
MCFACVRVRVSLRETMDASVVAIGRSAKEDVAEHTARLLRLVHAGCEYRRCGAATIGLLGVAAGWVKAYHEKSLNLWDCAAGIALIRAAGGSVIHGDLTDHMKEPHEVYATNGLNPDLVNLLISAETSRQVLKDPAG